MTKDIQIINTIILKYNVQLETGLHIGGNKDNYGIGGIDSPVIKNPLNNQPIIPGSSLKGKIRMLMEVVETDEYSAHINKKNVINMFGAREEKDKEDSSITRIIFRDLVLTNESVRELESKLGEGFYTEIKAENSIDRIKGKSNPRFQERIPAGAVFEGECIIQYQSNDNVDYLNLLKVGFKLLENNYLGGSGSRGYGKITINFIE